MPLPTEIFDSKGRLRNSPRIFVNLMKHADAADPYAQSLVGYCYLSGKGTSKDSDMARNCSIGGPERGRTVTGSESRWILSPLRLPIPPRSH